MYWVSVTWYNGGQVGFEMKVNKEPGTKYTYKLYSVCLLYVCGKAG